jgi:hypothetical protein
MEHQGRDLSPELNEFQINMQINAVTRVMELLGEGAPDTLDEAIEVLAFAETVSQFQCGFVDLNNSTEVKKQLKEEIVKRGFVTAEDGKITLTETGKERANTTLPPQIEAVLR